MDLKKKKIVKSFNYTFQQNNLKILSVLTIHRFLLPTVNHESYSYSVGTRGKAETLRVKNVIILKCNYITRTNYVVNIAVLSYNHREFTNPELCSEMKTGYFTPNHPSCYFVHFHKVIPTLFLLLRLLD